MQSAVINTIFIPGYCSHFYSVYYWAESVDNETQDDSEFVAVQCDNWNIFARGECNNNRRNIMGINADPK